MSLMYQKHADVAITLDQICMTPRFLTCEQQSTTVSLIVMLKSLYKPCLYFNVNIMIDPDNMLLVVRWWPTGGIAGPQGMCPCCSPSHFRWQPP